VKQVLLEGYGDGGFTASGETGKPEGEALLAAQGTAFVVGEAVVPCDISNGERVQLVIATWDGGASGAPTWPLLSTVL
jgi:hypothetical protein